MKLFLLPGAQKLCRLPLLALTFCALSTLWGCVVEEEAVETVESSTDTTVTNPPVGVVDDTAGFYVQARASEDYTYVTHRGDESGTTAATYGGSFGWTRDCTAALGDDIMCYVEAEELDLWFHGVVLQHNIPSTMCTYVGIEMPWFFTYPTGKGPTTVRYTTDSTTATTTITDVENSSRGTPYCPFDYSATEGQPNCCEGDYKTYATAMTTGPSGVEITVTETDSSWGGDASQCVAGPALDHMALDTAGYPLSKMYFASGVGINGTFEIASPETKAFGSNLYLANYFDIETTKNYKYLSASNATGLTTFDFPPAFSQKANKFLASTGGTTSFGTGTALGAVTIPIPSSSPALNSKGLELIRSFGNPYYSYTCYNRNQEILARIRVMVRSWDTTGQISSATTYAPNYLEEDGVGSTEPIHDMYVWGDLFFNYTDNLGVAVRKSWANAVGTANCTFQSPSTTGTYTSTTLPCQSDNTSYLNGFPQSAL